MRDQDRHGLRHDGDAPAHDDSTRVDYRPGAFPSVGGDTPSRATMATDEPPPLPNDPVVVTSEPARASAGGGRWRWIAAGVATVAVVAIIGGFFLFLGPRAGTPSLVAQYAPADAAAYGEIRLDLPGDQRDRLVEFMSKFPGFADPATFQQKLDDTLEQIFVSSNTGLSWKNDIDPWFGGQLAVYTPSLRPAIGTPPAVTFVFSVEDRARLDALIQSRLAGAGLQQEEYKGTVIWSGAPGGVESRRVNFAVTADALVVATRNEDLKRALDIRSGEIGGLAKDTFFIEQLAALHTDRLGAFYYDYSSVFDAIPPVGGGIPTACLDQIRAAADIKFLGELRAEGDHMALTVRAQIPTGENLPPAAPNRRSALLEQMPAGALAYLEMRQLGAAVDAGIRQLLECIPTGTGIQFDPRQIEQALGVPLADYFDFLGDAGIAVSFADGKPAGGIIATVDDGNVANARVQQLLGIMRLGAGGGGGGGGVTVEERDHNGVKLTVITFQSGLVQPTPPPSLAIAVANNRLYIGLDNFVVDALNRPAADSLAASTRLQAALAQAGAENAGLVYVDIAGLRALGESFMPQDARGRYDSEIKPFVEPLSHFVVVSRTDGGVTESDAFLYVE